jgi:hypothetical protein
MPLQKCSWLMKLGSTERVWPYVIGGFLLGISYAYLVMHLILDHLR